MSITERDVAGLQAEGIIDRETAARIRAWAGTEAGPTAHGEGSGWFDPARAAYYLGALLILFALGWFALEAWRRYGGWTLAGVAVAYAALFAILGERLWRGGWRIPGGLLFTVAAGMTPLFVFSVQAGLGIWPEPPAPGPAVGTSYSAHLVAIEVATILVFLATIRLRPFAFHAAALGAAFIALAIDLSPLIAGPLTVDDARTTLSLVMGLGLIGAAFLLDRRTGEDYSLWLYLAGILAYWVPFSANHVEDTRYLVVSLLAMVTAVLIRRRAFMVVGAVGVFVHLMYLAAEVFRDSLLFPVALSGIGLLFVLGGVAYARRQDRIRGWLIDRLPPGVRGGLPQNR